MKTESNNKMAVPHHVDDDDLVSYLDGELGRKAQEEVRTHLESCWNCRRRLNCFQRSIEKFLELRNDTLLPPELPPSGPAVELFRQRLSDHRNSLETPSYSRLRMPDWRAPFRYISGRFNLEQSALGKPGLVMRIAASLLLVNLIGGLFFLSNKSNTVSARELLKQSINSQTERINATSQPVVYQRLLVKRKNNSSASDDVTWEIWNDTTKGRIQQAAYIPEGKERDVSDNSRLPNDAFVLNGSSIPAPLTDLEKIFQINHMDERRPLSAASYQSWNDSVKSKTEEVIRSTQDSGLEVLTLKTVARDPVSVGRITEAQVTVRQADWHPTKLYLRVKADEGELEYELIENDFEVVSLKDLDPRIFSDESSAEEVALLPATTPKIVISPSPSASPDATPAGSLTEMSTPTVSPMKMPVVATNEAEVQVLDSLHKIGADINEQLNVTRTTAGRLMVEGLVETDKRKGEILQALAPIAKNPAITIKIQTIDEAALSLAQQKQKPAEQGVASKVEINKGALAVDTELREYFSKGAADADEQIRRYASRMINHSQSALFQASAMNRLANRFTAEQLRSLEPEARTKWLSIIRGYAAAVRRETSNLRQELDPVFFSGMGLSGAEKEAPINNDVELIRSAKRLYEMAEVNDRIVRPSFTLSTGNMSLSAIKTPQFRNSLVSTEKLAAALEKAR